MEYELVEKRVETLLEVVDKEKYPETYNLLEAFADAWFDDLWDFWGNIMLCDKKYPLEPNVAKLIEKFYWTK